MELTQLPVGACVRNESGSFQYHIAAQNHPGYAGTTLLSDQVVLIGPLDATEPVEGLRGVSPEDTGYGNNDFAKSNLLQWLNSGEQQWYVPQHPADNPPIPALIRNGAAGYADRPGFLTQLPISVRNRLLVSRVPVHIFDSAQEPKITYVETNVFLPSRTEMGMGDDYGLPEGIPLPLLRDIRFRSAVLTQATVEGYHGPWQPAFPMRVGGIWRYWLRSPHLHYRYLCRYVAEMGGLSFAPAYYEIVGCRPMMNVDGSLPVQRGDGPDNTYYLAEEAY